MTRTVIALYDDFNSANRAVRELKDSGFASDDISLMANDAQNEYGRYVNRDVNTVTDETTSGTAEGASVGAGIGAVLGGLGGLLIGLGALTIPGIGPVIAAGPLAAALTGLAGAGVGAVAGGVAGGIIGALVDMGVPEETAQYYAEGVRRGGVLVTVRSSDDMTNRAVDILNRFNPVDINQRATQWRETGWSGFDPNAGVYSTETRPDLSMDRDRYTMGEGSHISQEPARQGDTSMASDLGTGSNIGGGEMGTVSPTGYGRDLTPERDERIESDRPRADIFESRDTGRTVDPGMANPDSGHPRGAYRPEEGGHDVTDTYSTQRPDLYRPEEGGNADLSDTVYGHVDFSSYDDRFRSHFDTTFSGESYSYEHYQPAYRYGYELANDERYRRFEDWNQLEPEARRYWDERNPGTWDRFKMAVRHAWEEIKDTVD